MKSNPLMKFRENNRKERLKKNQENDIQSSLPHPLFHEERRGSGQTCTRDSYCMISKVPKSRCDPVLIDIFTYSCIFFYSRFAS